VSRYQPPELLAARHQLAGFRCRSEAQTAWLVEMAKQAHGTGTTRVFVVTEIEQPTVVATYAWCMASVGITELPERLRRGAGRYPQPVALLARLGVDERHEGQGLGAALLLDVISRANSLSEASLSDAIGCRGLLVHAEAAAQGHPPQARALNPLAHSSRPVQARARLCIRGQATPTAAFPAAGTHRRDVAGEVLCAVDQLQASMAQGQGRTPGAGRFGGVRLERNGQKRERSTAMQWIFRCLGASGELSEIPVNALKTERVSVCSGQDRSPLNVFKQSVGLLIPSLIPSFTICDG
jgi:hypothetical protein